MTYPPYPRNAGRSFRLYGALCAAGPGGLGRHAAACAYAGLDEPSADDLSQIGRYIGTLRPFLARHDLDVVISAGTRTFAEAWKLVSTGESVAKGAGVEPLSLAVRSPHDCRLIGGQRVSLPRLSCLTPSSAEARP